MNAFAATSAQPVVAEGGSDRLIESRVAEGGADRLLEKRAVQLMVRIVCKATPSPAAFASPLYPAKARPDQPGFCGEIA